MGAAHRFPAAAVENGEGGVAEQGEIAFDLAHMQHAAAGHAHRVAFAAGAARQLFLHPDDQAVRGDFLPILPKQVTAGEQDSHQHQAGKHHPDEGTARPTPLFRRHLFQDGGVRFRGFPGGLAVSIRRRDRRLLDRRGNGRGAGILLFPRRRVGSNFQVLFIRHAVPPSPFRRRRRGKTLHPDTARRPERWPPPGPGRGIAEWPAGRPRGSGRRPYPAGYPP